MDERVQVLVDASLALGLADRAGLEHALQAALVHAAPLEVEEALLQSYLFLGYPAALGALALWRRVSGVPAPAAAADDAALWMARGAETCARVYGGQYERLRENIAALHPDMEQWMVTEGYGKVLGRPGLDLPTRELCVVAVLAPQDARPQVYSHLRGALNAGAGAELVDAVVERVRGRLPAARAETLAQAWSAVRTRWHETRG